MLNLVAIVVRGYDKYMNRLARQRTLRVLAQQSDETLRDIGISRAMLNSGVTSRQMDTAGMRREQAESVTVEPRSTYHKVMSRRRAIRELRACSDRELRDIGITRGSIVEAVHYGRPRVDQTSVSTQRHTVTTNQPVVPAIAAAPASIQEQPHYASEEHQLADEWVPAHSSTSGNREAA